MSSAGIDRLVPVSPCCGNCDRMHARSGGGLPGLIYCLLDGMTVDPAHICERFLPLLSASSAPLSAPTKSRPSLVGMPSLGVSSLDLAPGASASGPF